MNIQRQTIKVTVDKSHLFTLGEKMYRESVEFLREIVILFGVHVPTHGGGDSDGDGGVFDRVVGIGREIIDGVDEGHVGVKNGSGTVKPKDTLVFIFGIFVIDDVDYDEIALLQLIM